MGEVVKLHDELMEVWDYAYSYIKNNGIGKMEGIEEYQKALDEGYEPYAVTHWMEQDHKTTISALTPATYMIEKHHMRRRHMVKKKPIVPTSPLLK